MKGTSTSRRCRAAGCSRPSSPAVSADAAAPGRRASISLSGSDPMPGAARSSTCSTVECGACHAGVGTHLGKASRRGASPLHEAGEGGISKKCRVRCGRLARPYKTRLHANALPTIWQPKARAAPFLKPMQQRPAPHPTSLREATLSSFVERDSHRAVAPTSEMCADARPCHGRARSPVGCVPLLQVAPTPHTKYPATHHESSRILQRFFTGSCNRSSQPAQGAQR